MPVDVSNMVAWRLMGQQQAEQQAEQQQQQQLAAQLLEQQRYDQQRADKLADQDFERGFKLAELEAKTATELGVGRPRIYNDPRIEAVAKFGEAQGLLKRHNDEVARSQALNDERVKHERALAKAKMESNWRIQEAGARHDMQLEENVQQGGIALARQDDAQEHDATESYLDFKRRMQLQDDAQAMALYQLKLKAKADEKMLGPSYRDRIEMDRLGAALGPMASSEHAAQFLHDFVMSGEEEGIGWLSGRVAATAADDASWLQPIAQVLTPDKAIQVRQAAADIFNNEIKNNSGATVTDKEQARNAMEMLLSPGVDKRQFYIGVQTLLNVRRRVAMATEARFPQALEMYRQSPGAVDSRRMPIITEEQLSPKIRKPPKLMPIDRGGQTYFWDATNEMWVGRTPPE